MSVATRRAIYGKLAGDSTLNSYLNTPPAGYAHSIYYEVAPDGADYPFVIFQKQAGTPQFGLNDTAPIVAEVWMIKAVDRDATTADVAEAIGERVKVLLDDASLNVSGVTHRFLRYESDTDYAEVLDNGLRYTHSGSFFRLIYT